MARFGTFLNLNPNRYFETEWYKWRNLKGFPKNTDAYGHYYNFGRHQLRSPSPLIDIHLYDRMHSSTGVERENYILSILDGDAGLESGVYKDLSVVESCQKAFLEDQKLSFSRLADTDKMRRNLVLVQDSHANLHQKWMRSGPRSWDLAVSFYDRVPDDFGVVPDCIAFAPGSTKTSALYRLFGASPLLDAYDYILVIDNDVEPEFTEIDRLFDLCGRNKLDLAQASLSAGSEVNWPVLENAARSGIRRTNAVEIMMPVLSRRALAEIGNLWGESISGWGIDLLIGQKVRRLAPRNIAVIDDIAWHHGKAVNPDTGPLYEHLRNHHILPDAEFWRIYKKYGIDKNILEA